MRSIVILFLLVGICLVVVGYVQSNQACPPPVVEFRYLPQTFEQEQNLQQPVLSTFGTMFNQDDSWMQTQGYADKVYSRQLSNAGETNKG